MSRLHLKQAVCPASINHNWAMLLMNLFNEGRDLIPVVSCTQNSHQADWSWRSG